MPFYGLKLKTGVTTHCLYCSKKKKKRYILWGGLVCKNKDCSMHYKSEKLKKAQKRVKETREEHAKRILEYGELDVNSRTMSEEFYGPFPGSSTVYEIKEREQKWKEQKEEMRHKEMHAKEEDNETPST